MAKSKPEALDVNRATREQLIALSGVGEALADAIRSHRPYESLADLVALRGISERNVRSLGAQGLTTTAEMERSGSQRSNAPAPHRREGHTMDEMPAATGMSTGVESMPGEATIHRDAMDVSANTDMSGSEFEMINDMDHVEDRIADMAPDQLVMATEPDAATVMGILAVSGMADETIGAGIETMTAPVDPMATPTMTTGSTTGSTADSLMSAADPMGMSHVGAMTDGVMSVAMGHHDEMALGANRSGRALTSGSAHDPASMHDGSVELLGHMPGEVDSGGMFDPLSHGEGGGRAGTELAELTGTFRLVLSL